ncbi:MAG TPA: PQQ-dependent sugar dehydrogenase [Fibrobacteria bacterium]|nr:PQQ-dependent sugar dehydrogenase [Fibrobacteria bacterium]
MALSLAALATAQWTYPGCPDVTNADFRYEVLAQRGKPSDPTMSEPVKMAFDFHDGVTDVYYVEMKGNLKMWSATTKTSKVVGHLWVKDSAKGSEEGLLGLALDPKFKENHFVYLFWTPAAPLVPPQWEFEYRLSRFTLAGDRMDMASEKILFRFPHEPLACCHSGGSMQFDAYGDLWIAIGGNGPKRDPMTEDFSYSTEEDGASSTADLRGGVVRIHPDDSPRGYSIPKGNFGAYFADKADKAGKPDLAAQYRDTALVKPEVYVKGMRNAYTMTIDPVRRWITVGDVGPDNHAQMEEHNLFKTPAFAGWPYFAGKNLMFLGNKDPNASTNNSKWNKGMKVLPPATPSIRSYATSTAITGPIYRYDGDLQSPGKFPPHFNRKWFIAEFTQQWVRVVTLDTSGTRIEKDEQIFKDHNFSNPVELQMGPDGSLYVINYAGHFGPSSDTRIERVTYAGPCRPDLPKVEKAPPDSTSSVVRLGGPAGRALESGTVLIGFDRTLHLAPGGGRSGRFELFDMQGHRVHSGEVPAGESLVSIPASVGRGLFLLRMSPSQGNQP